MLVFGAAAAVLQAYGIAAAADAADAGAAAGQADLANTLLATAADAGDQAWSQLRHWVSEGYQRAPALMLGLTVLLAVPPLALVGLIASRKRHRNASAGR